MLVLSRRVGETIRIGDDIVVQVVRISGNRVLIGIDAPKSLAIVRPETQDDVAAESEGSAGVEAAPLDPAPAARVAAKVPIVRFKKNRTSGF